MTFPAGRERNIALGVWGALAGIGGTLGVVAGGVLVDSLGWEWIFFVNVPVAIVALVATPLFVTESRRAGDAQLRPHRRGARHRAACSRSSTASSAPTRAGWGSAEVLGLFGAAVVLLGAFVFVESRAADPLVPLRLFRMRGLSVSALALALNGGAFLGMFFMTALYLQQVHGDSALDAGAHFVPMGIAAIASAVVGAQLVTRVGTRAAYLGGSAIGVVGLLLLSRAGADAGYATDLLPGLVVFGLGLPLVGVANQIAAVAEVPHEDAGAASGIVTAAFQVGGAIGLALVSTAATSRVTDARRGGRRAAGGAGRGLRARDARRRRAGRRQPASSAPSARRGSSPTPRSWRRRPRGSLEGVPPDLTSRRGILGAGGGGAPLPAHARRALRGPRAPGRPPLDRRVGPRASRTRRRSSPTRASTSPSTRTPTPSTASSPALPARADGARAASSRRSSGPAASTRSTRCPPTR